MNRLICLCGCFICVYVHAKPSCTLQTNKLKIVFRKCLPILQIKMFLIVLEFGVRFTGGNTLKSNVCMQL